jgi:hypothetical protein
MFCRTEGVLVYKIIKRDNRQRAVEYSKNIENKSKLMVWAEDVSGASPQSQIAIFSTDQCSITNTLVKGINVYDLPYGFLDNNPDLYMSSIATSVLPIIVTSEVFSTNIVIDLNSYENMPGTTVTLSSSPFWYSNDKWKRDRRHRKYGYPEPLTALSIYTDIPIYSTTPLQQATVRFNTVAKMRSKYIRNELSEIKFLVNSDVLIDDVKVVKYHKKGNRRFVTADLTSEKNIGVSGMFTFGIDLENANEITVFTDSVSFTFE